MKSTLFVLAICAGLAGCGTASPPAANCVTSFSLSVQPGTATADHMAAAPGNQTTFLASSGQLIVSGSCASTNLIADVSAAATWTTSDMVNVQLSGTPANVTPGEVATCSGATSEPVTVTATYTSLGVTKTATSQLTCK